jgi:hypothetical protein
MTSMSRRTVLTAAVGAAAAMRFGLPGALAQSATPVGEDFFGSLGYPELKVTINDDSFEGIPESIPAGRYLVTAIGNTSAPVSSDQNPPLVAFLSPTPAGVTADEFLSLFSAPPEGSPSAAGGSPEAGGDQGGDQALPLFVYQMKFAGGVITPTGESTQGVLDLTPGEWVAWGDDPTAAQKPVVFNVTGDFPSDVAEPEADITATLIDFAITMDGALTPGTHLIKVQHQGAQPHFLEIDKGPDTMTKEMVQAALEGEMTGTPVPGISDSELHPVFYSPTQSIGTATWHQVDFSTGTFMAACFFPTAGTGVPHAMNGMIDVFTIS